MKVGTDAVLLGAWVSILGAKQILDIGTGSGVIALMLAQRTDRKVKIDAIEIERADAAQARDNVLISSWPNKITVFEKSLQEFNPEVPYDLIISNPPFFIHSLLPPSPHRTRSRHTRQLTYDELISNAIRLMSTSGTLAVILPVHEGNHFRLLAFNYGLHLQRQLAFYSRKEKPQERWLFEFGLSRGLSKEEKLVLYDEDNVKSHDYINLTKDFYL